jgi:pantoate--beta-alanine ligase
MELPIKTLDSIGRLRAEISALRRNNLRIGFVPTMGYLHDGHLSLVELSKQRSDKTIVSIFVNPTQFNNPADLEKYPRDIPRDLAMLNKAGVHAVFMPTPQMMYGPDHESWVELSKLPLEHEGTHRPGHFRGMSTVVSMLFNLVQPDIAVFGEKDFQQLRIVERMVEDLKFPLKIIRGPSIREPDGLAMSSRNVRLDSEARAKALHISKGLFAAEKAFDSGERDAVALRSIVMKFLSRLDGVAVEYIEVVDESTLQRCDAVNSPSRILVAITVGDVRLIDNVALTPK